MSDMKVEIGPGDGKIDSDWVTVDVVKKPHIDHVAQWGADPLPFENNSVSLVYASHVLEHIPWYRTIDALTEAHRIICLGGRIEIWVPDFDYLVKCYHNETCGDDWRKFNDHSDPMLWLNGRLFTYGGPGGLGDPNWHRAVFNEEYLCACLKRAGFGLVERINGKPRGHDHGPINLGVTGCKV